MIKTYDYTSWFSFEIFKTRSSYLLIVGHLYSMIKSEDPRLEDYSVSKNNKNYFTVYAELT